MAKLTDARAFEGETLSEHFEVPNATGLSVTLKDGSNSAVISANSTSPGIFDFKTTAENFSGFSGPVRWIAMATFQDGMKVVANGTIYIRPLVSKYCEVVEKIEEAIQNWSTNPNMTVTCGEISITAKSVQDLFEARDRFKAKADADERGVMATGGPRLMRTSFGR